MYLLKTEGSQEYLFITDSIPDVICILYADDIANCVDTAINIQFQLNSISDCCRQTGMVVNENKT